MPHPLINGEHSAIPCPKNISLSAILSFQLIFLTNFLPYSPGKQRSMPAGKKGDMTKEQFLSDRKGIWKTLLVGQGESVREAALKVVWTLLWVSRSFQGLHKAKTIFMILLRHCLLFTLSLFQEGTVEFSRGWITYDYH